MAHPLLFDSTWLQQFKYESAEAYYQQILSGTGGVKPVTQTSNKPQESSLKSEIAQARQNIQKALNDSSTGEQSAGGAVDEKVLGRIKSLESENTNLKKASQDLTALVKKLEARVSALESGNSSSQAQPAAPAKQAANDDDDDDFDPFGSDSESEDDETKEKVAAYKAKKANKPTLIAKSSLLIDVKPWDDETDMKELEQLVRSVEMDGLLWGASKLVPVGYGIKKLQIAAVIEDDKISTDDLEEKITAFEDFVQSMDIAAFNKI